MWDRDKAAAFNITLKALLYITQQQIPRFWRWGNDDATAQEAPATQNSVSDRANSGSVAASGEVATTVVQLKRIQKNTKK